MAVIHYGVRLLIFCVFESGILHILVADSIIMVMK